MTTYSDYQEYLARVADLYGALNLLNWDQETYMPAGSINLRSRQVATLSGVVHQQLTSSDYHQLLLRLSDDNSLSTEQRKNVSLSLSDYEKKSKLPTAFVEKLNYQTSSTFQAWQEAKNKNDFTLFEKPLNDLIQLKFKEAEYRDPNKDPYNVLLDDYEPGANTQLLDSVFSTARKELSIFLENYKSPIIDFNILHQPLNKQKQWDFTLYLLDKLGYNTNYGRQDISSHPFSISFGSEDARITTRVNENNLSEIIWSTIHECGHALYEMGLLSKNYGLPAGEACSLSIHESQSRLWENIVGRSLPFIEYIFPILQNYFPEQLNKVTLPDFYTSVNHLQPSLIRTNADEVTYHFHVFIRYEIEKALFSKQITVKELPTIWNELYKKYLNIDVPNMQQGVLQDVHWSHGSFGYFPTYSLGSFYSAQFYAQAKKEIPNLEDEYKKGNFSLFT